MSPPARVLICDDSTVMRAILRGVLESSPAFQVVGEAADAYEAREKIKALSPDVLTLDVEMPRMDGVSFLEKIMRLRPMPVVMVSTLTERGAEVTLAALELGAAGAVLKPTAGDERDFERFSRELKAACQAAAQSRPSALAKALSPAQARSGGPGRLIAIGASTGGVEALHRFLPALPAGGPPVLIVQHMPGEFTPRFAERLNAACAMSVREARDGELIEPGTCLVAPGGRHLEVVGQRTALRCRLSDGELVSGHRPSADVLFRSVAAVLGADAVGVILTGMGRDGAEGLKAMRTAGAYTCGQSAASCLIYGMPKAAAEIGALTREAPLESLPDLVLAAAYGAAATR